MQNKSWTLTVEQDPESGDLVLPFPQDFLDEAGWKEGDTLEWIDNQDGSWSLVKKKQKKKNKVVAKSKTI
jgi:bifunctional DNA-binding transcriptional regulator/antitoxin component of YhaV-PrlF toxin-antitoxin module